MYPINLLDKETRVRWIMSSVLGIKEKTGRKHSDILSDVMIKIVINAWIKPKKT